MVRPAPSLTLRLRRPFPLRPDNDDDDVAEMSGELADLFSLQCGLGVDESGAVPRASAAGAAAARNLHAHGLGVVPAPTTTAAHLDGKSFRLPPPNCVCDPRLRVGAATAAAANDMVADFRGKLGGHDPRLGTRQYQQLGKEERSFNQPPRRQPHYYPRSGETSQHRFDAGRSIAAAAAMAPSPGPSRKFLKRPPAASKSSSMLLRGAIRLGVNGVITGEIRGKVYSMGEDEIVKGDLGLETLSDDDDDGEDDRDSYFQPASLGGVGGGDVGPSSSAAPPFFCRHPACFLFDPAFLARRSNGSLDVRFLGPPPKAPPPGAACGGYPSLSAAGTYPPLRSAPRLALRGGASLGRGRRGRSYEALASAASLPRTTSGTAVTSQASSVLPSLGCAAGNGSLGAACYHPPPGLPARVRPPQPMPHPLNYCQSSHQHHQQQHHHHHAHQPHIHHPSQHPRYRAPSNQRHHAKTTASLDEALTENGLGCRDKLLEPRNGTD